MRSKRSGPRVGSTPRRVPDAALRGRALLASAPPPHRRVAGCLRSTGLSSGSAAKLKPCSRRAAANLPAVPAAGKDRGLAAIVILAVEPSHSSKQENHHPEKASRGLRHATEQRNAN